MPIIRYFRKKIMSSRALRKLQDNIDIPGAEEEQSEEDEVRVDKKKQKGFNAFLLVSFKYQLVSLSFIKPYISLYCLSVERKLFRVRSERR